MRSLVRNLRETIAYSGTMRPPVNILSTSQEEEIDLPVPANQEQAEKLLVMLYDKGRDRLISRSFDKFHAALQPSNKHFIYAYMAEINLGINGQECDKDRIVTAIEELEKSHK